MSHEKTDIRLRPIGIALAIFLVVAVAVHIGVWFLFDYLRLEQERRDVRRSLIETRQAIPPQPRLQVDPYRDLNEYRKSQQQILDTYDWASREQGRVRIPIRRAMEQLAKGPEKKEQEKKSK
jgi:hypothetical protein